MSHVLLHTKFDQPPKWMFWCECGHRFGLLSELSLSDCLGDMLDCHREHVRAHLELEDKLTPEFGFFVLNPARGSILANRILEVNLRLFAQSKVPVP